MSRLYFRTHFSASVLVKTFLVGCVLLGTMPLYAEPTDAPAPSPSDILAPAPAPAPVTDADRPDVEFRVPDAPPAVELPAEVPDSGLFQSYPDLSEQSFLPNTSGRRLGGSLFEDTFHDTIISRNQLNEIRPRDMGEALETQPGVFIQRTGRGQASPFIRGLTGQQVLILVDGVRMSNATFRAGPNQYFSLIDPNMVDHIEVMRGPGAVEWGSDAIGGVINVVTRGATRTGADYLRGSTIQQFSTADLGYAGRVNVEGWYRTTGVFGGIGYGNFNELDRGGGLGRQDATSFRSLSGDVKVTRVLDDYHELIFAVQHFEQNDVFRTDRFLKGDTRVFDPQQRDLAYIRLNGHDLGGLCDSYSLTVSFNRMKEDQLRYPETAPPYSKESLRRFSDNQFGATSIFTKDLDQFGKVAYGVDFYHEHINSVRRDTNLSTHAVTYKLGPYPDDSYYTRLGAFLKWKVDLTDRLTAESGVRYSYIKSGARVRVVTSNGTIDSYINPHYDDVSANIGLTYRLSDTWNLVGSVAEGFRPPNLDDYAATNDNTFAGTQIPNPTLRPERSLNYEIGLKTNQSRFRGQAFFFYTDISNHILRRPQGDPNAPNFVLTRENRDSKLYGVELAGEYLLTDEWSLYGNFSHVYGQDTQLNEPLSRVNPTQGIAGLRWRSECGMNWFDTYVWMVDRQDRLSARDLADHVRIPADGTPGYATFNVRIGHMLDEHQRIILNVYNITDKLYRVHGSGSDGPGIDVVLGYEWTH